MATDPTNDERLLQVTLVDNATVGLNELKRKLDELAKTGSTDRFKAQASAVQEVMKSFGLVAGGVAKAFEGLAGK